MLALFAAGLMFAAKTGSVPFQAPSASVRPDSAQKPHVDGTIEFSLKSCGRSAAGSYGEIVKIVVASSDGTTVDTPTWSFGGKTSLRARLNVPAGVYSYRARNNVGCVMSGSVAVLPGSVRKVEKTLHPYVTITLLPRLHLYGTAPPGTSISVVRYSASLDCNSDVANAPKRRTSRSLIAILSGTMQKIMPSEMARYSAFVCTKLRRLTERFVWPLMA